MAIYHCHTHAISRAGRSGTALACAAYRSGEKLREAQGRRPLSAAELAAYRTGGAVADGSGKVHDYTRKAGVAHTQIILPRGVDAAWAQDRAALWNQAEAAERRVNSRVAREWRVALPHELNAAQRVALARDFAQVIVDRYGVAADMAVHAPSRSGDQRNWHAHILCTTRAITNEGFGDKTPIEWSNTNLKAAKLPYSALQIRELRMAWQECANAHLAAAGYDAGIDHRSYAEQGISLEAARTMHVGQMHAQERDRITGSERILPLERLDAAQSEFNAAVIAANPDTVLALVTAQASVFTRANVAATLHRFVNEDWQQFDRTLETVMGSQTLVRLMAGGRSDQGREIEDVFSTKQVASREAAMLDCAERLAASGARGMPERAIAQGIAVTERGTGRPFQLAQEQRDAVHTIAGAGQLAILRGVAGTGKTTALSAVRAAAEAAGIRILGGALAGKAARELADGSGIESRTLASLERSWEAGFDTLGRGDMLVVDEAGMVGSAQMGRIMAQVEAAGAKLVLVGDERQLQPIEAGAAFRNIKERALGWQRSGAPRAGTQSNSAVAELGEVRRQTQSWQREAAQAFGRGEAGEALDAYYDRGDVRLHDSTEQTYAAIVQEYFLWRDADSAGGASHELHAVPSGAVAPTHAHASGPDHIVTAYRNVDVAALNAAIREARVARGELGADALFQTDQGVCAFAVGDKILLTQNARALGVSNGDRGDVIAADPDRIAVRLTDGREVRLEAASYDGVRHGYAVTTHRAQGMTVDRVHVMAGQGMHASLAYVAMTRQRQGATLHASRDHFRDYATLRESIARERQALGVGDYLPDRNALAAVRERIAQTDQARAKSPLASASSAQTRSTRAPSTGAPDAKGAQRGGATASTGLTAADANRPDSLSMQLQARIKTAQVAQAKDTSVSRLERLKALFVRGSEQEVSEAGTAIPSQKDAANQSRAQDVAVPKERPAPQASDAQASLRQRLLDHAAGQGGGAAGPDHDDRLRAKLAEHAAGGAQPTAGQGQGGSAAGPDLEEHLRAKLTQHAAGEHDAARQAGPSSGPFAGPSASKDTSVDAEKERSLNAGRGEGLGREDDTGAGR